MGCVTDINPSPTPTLVPISTPDRILSPIPAVAHGSGGGGGDNPSPVPNVVDEEAPVVPRQPVFERRLALFLVDFPDNDRAFPDPQDIEKNLEEGVVREYFDDISYGQFTYEIDSFGPFTHQDAFELLYPHHQTKVLSINTIDIPDFDPDIYDIFVLVSASDYEFEAAISYAENHRAFRVNGEVVNREKKVLVHPLFIGCRERNCVEGYLENKLTEKDGHNTDSPFTIFQRIFIHELIHNLGVWGHANSRTNGSRFDHEPEIQNNEDNLNRTYGNLYDIVGRAEYGYNLNAGYRDLLGWLEPPRKIVIEGYGCFTATVDPINDADGTVAVEIRIPGEMHRYYLEARDFTDKWDSLSPTPDRQRIIEANRQGVMVNRAEDIPGVEFFPTYLLDMSPSPNHTEPYYEGVPDISDVVLKPGGLYDAPDLRLWDVTPVGDDSFSVRIMVKSPDNQTHESCTASDFRRALRP